MLLSLLVTREERRMVYRRNIFISTVKHMGGWVALIGLLARVDINVNFSILGFISEYEQCH